MSTTYYFAPKNGLVEIGLYGGGRVSVRGDAHFNTYGLRDGGIAVDWRFDKREALSVLRRHYNDPCVVDERGVLHTGAQTLAILRSAVAAEYADGGDAKEGG